MGIGSNTHHTTQMTVTPNAVAASAEKPAQCMRYAANNARMGPAGRAMRFVFEVDFFESGMGAQGCQS
jgi:hypothetical protein